MRQRYLTVPLNSRGMTAYDTGIEQSDDLRTVLLPESEWNALLPVFQRINETCGLLIDDCESEIIPGAYLLQCRSLISGMTKEVPVFTEMLQMAIDLNTMLALDF